MRLRDEQGMMAIGAALMLIVVLSLFGGVLWQYSMAEMRRVERTEQDMQALFLARAGAEAVMSVWLDPEQSRPELPISMDPIYYNPTVGLFSSPTRPDDYRGIVEVTIKKEDYVYDGEVTEVTVIQSVATVGSIARTARLMTYPHRYGHDLAWYSDETGRIYSPASPARSAPGELVVMRTNPPETGIFIGKDSIAYGGTIPFEAGHLVFESPLHLAKSTDNLKTSPSGDVDVVLRSEMVFLQGLELAYFDGVLGEKNYGIELRLPSGENKGKMGSDIKDNVAAGMVHDSARYGEIYFDANPFGSNEYDVNSKKYEGFTFLGWSYVVPRETHELDLDGKAFYFQDGTRLDPKVIHVHVINRGSGVLESESIAAYFTQLANTGILVPIKEEEQLSREELENIQPFFWDQ